jgi:hypothetical protein
VLAFLVVKASISALKWVVEKSALHAEQMFMFVRIVPGTTDRPTMNVESRKPMWLEKKIVLIFAITLK